MNYYNAIAFKKIRLKGKKQSPLFARVKNAHQAGIEAGERGSDAFDIG